MDMASAFTGLATLVMTTTKTITPVAHTIHDGPQYIQDLWDEICRFYDILRKALRLFRANTISNSFYSDTINAAVAHAHQTFQEINLKAEEFKKGTEQQRHRFAWLQREETFQSYHGLLKQRRLQIVEALNLIQIEHMQRMLTCMREPRVLEFCRDVGKEMRGNAEFAYCESSEVDDHPVLEINSNDATANSLDEPIRLRCKATSPQVKTNTWFRRMSSRGCQNDCQCNCHRMPGYHWPDSLRRTLDRLFVGFRGRPSLVPRCSRTKCQLAKAQSRKTTRVLESSLLNRAISILLLLRGLKLNDWLRSHRIVSESSEVARCAEFGDLEGLKRLILNGFASARDSTPDGWSLLHTTAYNGHYHAVKFLLRMGGDVDACEIGSRKASHFAKFRALVRTASEEEKSLSKLFQNEGDFMTDFELSPVHVAVLHEYDVSDSQRPKLHELLDFIDRANSAPLDEDWSYWKRSYRGKSPLFQDIIENFQQKANGQRGEPKEFNDLVNQPDAKHGWTPLQWAAFVDRKVEFEALILHGADPFAITSSGRNVFHQAAESKSHEIISFLLREGYHRSGLDINLPDIWGETPLHVAAARSPKCVSLLLKHGARTDVFQLEGLAPLHYAKHLNGQKRFDTVKRLLEHKGEQINAKSNEGRTPLFGFLDTPDCVSLLLDQNAMVDCRDNEGKTVLHHACHENRPQSLKMLLGRCPESLAVCEDKSGDTPLVEAFRQGSAICVMFLLERAPISSFEFKDGWSLLHHAARLGDAEVLEFVLRIPRVNRNSLTKKGQSAKDIARDAGTYTGRVRDLLCELDSSNEEHLMNLNRRHPTRGELLGVYR